MSFLFLSFLIVLFLLTKAHCDFEIRAQINRNNDSYSLEDRIEAEAAVESLLNTLGIKTQSDILDIDEDQL